MHIAKHRKNALLIVSLFFLSNGYAQDYQDIWDLLNRNQRTEAQIILEKKIKENTITLDEYITYMYVKQFDGKEGEVTDYYDRVLQSDNPESYLYAHWFSLPVVGDYGHKEPHQLKLLNNLISSGHGTLRASSLYHLGHHYIRAHQFHMLNETHAKIGAIENWQFVGPFSNLSGSGFNKNHEPINEPSNSAVFFSTNNAPIKWYTPLQSPTDGWVSIQDFIPDLGSTSFAQTFIQSETEQEVYLCTGFSGNIKVWVNDQLIVRVPEERTTEIDSYNSKCHLHAGFNRILVQLSSEESDPNFIIRLTDTNYNPIPNLKTVPEPQPYPKIGGEYFDGYLPLFAETYFEEKVRQEPGNLLNYMILARTYLRNNKVFDARSILEQALAMAPDNSILKLEILLCHVAEDNRTRTSEVYEYFLEYEPKSVISYIFRIKELEGQEKYHEALELIEERVSRYGKDESTYESHIQILAELNRVPELIAVITEAYQEYPQNAKFFNYVFNVEQKINKNPKKAVKLLEEYLAHHYDYALSQLLIREYYNLEYGVKSSKIIAEQVETWPYDPIVRLDQLKDHFSQQRYNEAYAVCEDLLKIKPYSGTYYENKAQVEEALGKKNEAIESYRKALIFEPTLYDSRAKLRALEEKEDLLAVFSEDKIDSLISITGKNINSENHDYYFIQYETSVILHPEGGREVLQSTAIRILNQRGIDYFSEFSLPYNSDTETLNIEIVELIKANGTRIRPEMSDNQIVWTGLEVNDIIHFRYRVQSYLEGKFGQEFYDNFTFDGYIPVELSRYSLIVPGTKKFNYKVLNGDIVPQVSESDGYLIYVWKKNALAEIKEEPYMPPPVDFASTLHISTMDDWNEIAEWYSDVVYSKIANDNDYEVAAVYKELFGQNTSATAEEKARTIYDYIARNISYSSVSFRQSGIVPQKASKTIHTRLGDCKDISTLFVSLANLCGLKSNLVLVSTRDNGQKDMLLPSFLFNHCIVRYFDDNNVPHYLELTDRDMPFKSLPSELYQAMSLNIPARVNEHNNHTLQPLDVSNKNPDKYITRTSVQIEGSDMNLTTSRIRYGSLSKGIRSTYRSLSEENAKKEVLDFMSGRFTNLIKIHSVSFDALNENLDSVAVNTTMSAVNEVKKIGSVSAFTIPFIDIVFDASPFNLDDRSLDFEYWNYENADMYETDVVVILPADKSFLEVPSSEEFSYDDFSYSISYTVTAPNRLFVSRKCTINRNNITPENYAAFKSFVLKVIDKEGAYVTFK